MTVVLKLASQNSQADPCLYSSPMAREKSVSNNQVTGEVSGARQFAGLSQGPSQSAA